MSPEGAARRDFSRHGGWPAIDPLDPEDHLPAEVDLAELHAPNGDAHDA